MRQQLVQTHIELDVRTHIGDETFCEELHPQLGSEELILTIEFETC
jgi:hypothetical protein